MKLHLVCNPVSGNGLGRRTGEKVQEMLTERQIPFTIHWTKEPGHATYLAADGKNAGADRIVVVGGDGTLSEAVSGALWAGLPLGIISAGTGNDFIKSAGIPAKLPEALDCCLNCAPKPTDVLRFNERLVLNEAGTGFDVMVLMYAEKAKKIVHGLLPYLYGVIQTIFRFKSIRIRYQTDNDEPVTRDVLVVAAGNGQFIGGGIPIAPEARTDDGLIDFVLVNGMKKTRMLSVLPGLLKGKILSFPETEFKRVKKLTLEGKGLAVNVDGEIITVSRAQFEILPGALQLLRP